MDSVLRKMPSWKTMAGPPSPSYAASNQGAITAGNHVTIVMSHRAHAKQLITNKVNSALSNFHHLSRNLSRNIAGTHFKFDFPFAPNMFPPFFLTTLFVTVLCVNCFDMFFTTENGNYEHTNICSYYEHMFVGHLSSPTSIYAMGFSRV